MAHPALVQLGSFVGHSRHKGRAREDVRQEYKVRLQASKSYRISNSADLNEKRRDGRIRGGRMAGFERSGKLHHPPSLPPGGHHHAGCRGGMRRGLKREPISPERPISENRQNRSLERRRWKRGRGLSRALKVEGQAEAERRLVPRRPSNSDLVLESKGPSRRR